MPAGLALILLYRPSPDGSRQRHRYLCVPGNKTTGGLKRLGSGRHSLLWLLGHAATEGVVSILGDLFPPSTTDFLDSLEGLVFAQAVLAVTFIY